jgi:hypothetical protein
MILFNSVHPYKQNESPKILGNYIEFSKNGKFPYSPHSLKETQKNIQYSKPSFKIWSHLPGYIKKAFYNLFSANGANFAVGKRIPISTWISLFKTYYKQLEDGSLEKVDPEANEPVPEDPINYDVLNKFSPTSHVEALAKGLVIKDLISKTLASIGYPNSASVSVSEIIKDLQTMGFYKTKDLAVELIVDLGIYKEVKFLYQKF